ncbi:MAG: UvrD-helicase domain-containing protein [Deltaproteobacteria bacterium]|nr:UvrD-helicase domain-containing protein [Deltaproteobacteria bacterium]
MATASEAARLLATKQRAAIIAPAGSGKTHLIAEAVAKHTSGRQLILTHTHAGVAALRRRLKNLGAASHKYEVETIAGWTLRFATSFSASTGITSSPATAPEWRALYSPTCALLERRPLIKVLRASYAGVFVDEYQDCTVDQHAVILALAACLPCRVVGDPLQSIFGFGDNKIVSWSEHVAPSFETLPELEEPWRWKQKNEPLGHWLLNARVLLQTGSAVSLTDAPVTWHPSGTNPQKAIAACLALANATESVVAINQWARQSRALAKCLLGRYSCVEAIEDNELEKAASAIEGSHGVDRALAVIDFVGECCTKVSTETKTIRAAIQKGKASTSMRKHLDQYQALRTVAENADIGSVAGAVRCLTQIEAAHVYRYDAIDDMLRSVAECARGSSDTLVNAIKTGRERKRRLGRHLHPRSVGQTLLIKGLEFDHAVIFDAHQFDRENLYVALTRGCRSLTVFSREATLGPFSTPSTNKLAPAGTIPRPRSGG